MFMILFALLNVYCTNEIKVKIFLSEPDTTVPFTDKLIMEASVLQKYISGYLLKEVSLQKILEMDAINEMKNVYKKVSELCAENILLLEHAYERKKHLEGILRQTKMICFIRHFTTQLRYENIEIKEIETMQEHLTKLKENLKKLNDQILNPTKTICIESHLQEMKFEAENNINILLKIYKENITNCTSV